MSAPHRYQSRFFQTIQSQVRQVKDTAQFRWRQLKMAAAWGVQLSLYPLYRIFQAGCWGARILGAQAARGAHRLRAALGMDETATKVDQPIRNVLVALKLHPNPAPSPELPTWQIDLVPIAAPKPLWHKSAELLRRLRHGLADLLLQPKPAESLALSTRRTKVMLVLMPQPLWEKRVSLLRPLRAILAAFRFQSAPLQPLALPTQQDDLAPVAASRPIGQKGVSLLRQWWHSRLQKRSVTALQTPTTALAPLPVIQGVASSLSHRQLVLVVANNQVLDILTVEQQQKLYQRIIWEIAIARRSRRSFQLLRPLRLAPQRLRALPTTVRRALMTGLGAIALLPFTLALPAPAQAAMPALPLPLPSPIAVEWLMDPSRTRKRSQAETDLSGQLSRPSAGKVRVPVQKTATTLQESPFQGAITDWLHRCAQTTVSEGSPAIEVDAVFLGYQRHLLERLLQGLDQGMAWLEPHLIQLWHRWQPVVQQGMQKAIVIAKRVFAIVKPWLVAQWIRFWQDGWPVIRKGLRYVLAAVLVWLRVQMVRLWNALKPAAQKWWQARRA